MERCGLLASYSDEAGRLTRPYGGAAMRAAGEAVAGWMRQAGMEVRRDGVGNLIGRYGAADPAARTLLLGSHLDSVRDAGRYDGPLGILVALACVERLNEDGERFPFAVEVVAFADEEGLRFHTAYLGSQVMAGTFDPAQLELRDADGTTLAEAISAFGGDPLSLAAERRDPAEVIGYVEVHIEQGPVLEQHGLAVGVVSGIAGQSRIAVELEGAAGHAGTVPMESRRDALCGAAELVLVAEALARSEAGLVATVGQIGIEPQVSNVIPGRSSLTLDVRHTDDAARERACRVLHAGAGDICSGRGLSLGWQPMHESRSVPSARWLSQLLARAIEARGLEPHWLPSGAGHDAVAMAALTDVAMLFVRCRDGISHHPAESVEPADVAVAIDVTSGLLSLVGEAEVAAAARGGP